MKLILLGIMTIWDILLIYGIANAYNAGDVEAIVFLIGFAVLITSVSLFAIGGDNK